MVILDFLASKGRASREIGIAAPQNGAMWITGIKRAHHSLLPESGDAVVTKGPVREGKSIQTQSKPS